MSGFINWDAVDASGTGIVASRFEMPPNMFEIQRYDPQFPNQFPSRIFFIVQNIDIHNNTEINDIRSSFRKFCTRIFGGKKMQDTHIHVGFIEQSNTTSSSSSSRNNSSVITTPTTTPTIIQYNGIFVVNRFGLLPNINLCLIELISEWKKQSKSNTWVDRIIDLKSTKYFRDGGGIGNHSYWTIPLAQKAWNENYYKDPEAIRVTGIEGELIIQISSLPFFQTVCNIKPVDTDVSYMPKPAPHLTRKRRRGGSNAPNGSLNFTIIPTGNTTTTTSANGNAFDDIPVIDFDF